MYLKQQDLSFIVRSYTQGKRSLLRSNTWSEYRVGGNQRRENLFSL